MLFYTLTVTQTLFLRSSFVTVNFSYWLFCQGSGSEWPRVPEQLWTYYIICVCSALLLFLCSMFVYWQVCVCGCGRDRHLQAWWVWPCQLTDHTQGSSHTLGADQDSSEELQSSVAESSLTLDRWQECGNGRAASTSFTGAETRSASIEKETQHRSWKRTGIYCCVLFTSV